MEYKEASEICRNNPGSYFKRGPTGKFIVYLEDGKTIPPNNSQSNHQSPQNGYPTTPPNHDRSHITPSKEIENQNNRIGHLEKELTDQNNRIGDLETKFTDQNNAIDFLIKLTNSQKEIIDNILTHKSKIKSDLEKIQKSITQIPDCEWDRYKEIKNKEEIEKKEIQRRKLIESAKDGKLDYERIRLVLDRSEELNLTEDDISLLKEKLIEKTPKPSGDHGFVVYGD